MLDFKRVARAEEVLLNVHKAFQEELFAIFDGARFAVYENGKKVMVSVIPGVFDGGRRTYTNPRDSYIPMIGVREVVSGREYGIFYESLLKKAVRMDRGALGEGITYDFLIP